MDGCEQRQQVIVFCSIAKPRIGTSSRDPSPAVVDACCAPFVFVLGACAELNVPYMFRARQTASRHNYPCDGRHFCLTCVHCTRVIYLATSSHCDLSTPILWWVSARLSDDGLVNLRRRVFVCVRALPSPRCAAFDILPVNPSHLYGRIFICISCVLHARAISARTRGLFISGIRLFSTCDVTRLFLDRSTHSSFSCVVHFFIRRYIS